MLQEEWNSRMWRNGDDANDGICQTAYLTVSILPSPSVWATRKAFRAKWAASFSSAASSCTRKIVTKHRHVEHLLPAQRHKKRMAGVSSLCLCSTVVLGHDVDIVSDADRGSRRGMDAVRHCSVSGGRLRCRGTASHDEPNFIAGRPRRPCVTLLFLPGSLGGLPEKKLY
jgi:hypothetical protein